MINIFHINKMCFFSYLSAIRVQRWQPGFLRSNSKPGQLGDLGQAPQPLCAPLSSSRVHHSTDLKALLRRSNRSRSMQHLACHKYFTHLPLRYPQSLLSVLLLPIEPTKLNAEDTGERKARFCLLRMFWSSWRFTTHKEKRKKQHWNKHILCTQH